VATESFGVDLFSLSKRTAFGRSAEIYAAANAFAEAEFSTRRGFNMNARLGAFANAGGNVRKFVAATLDLKAMAKAELVAQAQFPLDFFRECGAVCRLAAVAEAAVYGSLSIGLALEDFRRAFAAEQSGIALRLGEIFLDEVTVEGGVWAKAALTAQAQVNCVVAGSLLPNPKAGRAAGFTASVEWGLGFLYGTGFSAFAKIGFRDPRRLVARTSDELTAVLLELVERKMSRDKTVRASVPYVRMLLPVALRSCYELGLTAIEAKPGAVRHEVRAKLLEIVESEATAFASEMLLATGLKRMRRLLEDPKTQKAAAALSTQDAAEARRALDAFQAAIPRRPSLTNVPKLLGPFLDFAAKVHPENIDEWIDVAAIVWAALTTLGRDLVASGAAEAISVPDPGPRVRAHVNRVLQRTSGAALDVAAAEKFLVAGKALPAMLAAFPELGPAVTWLARLFSLAGGNATELAPDQLEALAKFVFGTPLDRVKVTDEMWARLRAALTEAARTQLEREVLPLLDEVGGDEQTKEFIAAVVKPALLSLSDVVLDNLDSLTSAEGRLVFREQVSLLLLQVIGRSAVICGDILIARALSEGARGMRSLASDLKGSGRSDFVSFAETALKFTGAESPRKKLTDTLEFGAALADLWDAGERKKMREGLLEMMDLLGSRRDSGSVWKKLASSKSFLPNLKQLQAFLKNSALQLGKLILRAIQLYFEQLFVDLKEAVKLVGKALLNAAKAMLRTLQEALNSLKQQLRAIVDAVKQVLASIKNFGRTIKNALAELKARATSKVFRDRALDLLRGLGEAGMLAAVRAFPPYRAIPKFLRKGGEKIARKAYRAAFDGFVRPILKAVLTLVPGLAAGVLSAASIARQLTPQNLLAKMSTQAKDEFKRAFGGKKGLSIGIKLGKKKLRIPIPLPVDAMANAFGNLFPQDGQLLRAAGIAAGAENQQNAAERELKNQQAKQGQQDAKVQAAQQRFDQVGNASLKIDIASPKAGEVYARAVPLNAVIRGANETYLNPPAGGARRIEAVLDGRALPFRAADWRWDAVRRELHFDRRLEAGAKPNGHTFSVIATDRGAQRFDQGVAFATL
jgi:hypothetical protein